MSARISLTVLAAPDVPQPPPAKNIDVLSYRPCDQQCRQCSYVEPDADPEGPRGSAEEVAFLRRLRASYPEATMFLYPRDIVTAKPLLPVMQEVRQPETLTNGHRLTPALVDELLAHGLKQVQITLFGTATEQEFYNRNTADEYERIKANVRLCADRGLRVQINNVLARDTMHSMEAVCDAAVACGAHRVRFLRLVPTGDAGHLPKDLLLTWDDLVGVVIPTFERLKAKYGPRLYLAFGVNFGPNFHGKTVAQARDKIVRRNTGVQPEDQFCPAVGGEYWNVSTQSGNVHWCFMNVVDENQRIGKVDWDTGRVTIDRPVDLSRETLRRRLGGACAAEACAYQEVCFGGCRTTAQLFATGTAEERLYAGMDMCLTPAYARYAAARAAESE